MKKSTSSLAVLAVAVVALSMSGCGRIDQATASLTGSIESCVSGVVYIQFTTGVTVKYQPDGKVEKC